ncbi:DUF397 domain-containing protein [Streptomyces orinoci]|uniref:DUF397 domain-containing protein n=1 Tax=Streptomyces orinoci TaxID=67339 RepID=A0ABV3JPN9_STRON|nr:DUF397 domain-containing protein [Streptomyces orinoci]
MKSSYSDGNGGTCVEWAPTFASGIVPVRDSKAPHGPFLAFPASSWSTFVNGVQNGELPTA